MAAPSFQDYFAAGRAEAINRRPDLTFDEGDISEFLVAAVAAMADHLTGYFAGRFKATYLDGAEGDDLTTLADDHWNVQRFEASNARGNTVFSRPAGPTPAGTILAGAIVATDKDVNGKEVQYSTDVDVNWGLGDLGPKTVSVTCTVAGIEGNADLNKVKRIVSSTFDSTIVAINSTSKMVGGDDAETDPDLRERVRGLPATLRRGTLAAIEYGALTVAGVKRATAVEDLDNLGSPTGMVSVYVTDGSGNSSPTMTTAVATELRNWRAAGVIVNTYGGTLQVVDVTLVLAARLGVNTTALASKVVAAVTSRMNKLRINETLSRDIIRQATLNVDEGLLSVGVTLPATDVVPATGTIIRPGTITVA